MTDLVRPDAASLAEAAADWMVQRFATTPGRLAVSLSGGSTPKILYETLARTPWRDLMPWDRVHWFWGDERFVPSGDKASNQGMVRRAMLDHVPAPAANIHPVPTGGLTPEDAATEYEAELRRFHGGDLAQPLFDLVLLGLGTNGHTASLFPGEAVVEERTAWAAPVTPPGEPTRITLTWPPLESCRTAAFLVAGADKRDVVARVRAGDRSLVAARYRPAGALHWWLDADAAGSPAPRSAA
ncbi:MAG: 6-phosphogluconolactonase [Janthinobacterium lividum]